jgi:thiol-disulfide isomerase/thioredoxin
MTLPGAARLTSAILLCAFASCDKAGTSKQAPPPAGSGSGSQASAAVIPPTPPEAPTEPGTWYLAKLVYKDLGELPFFLHLPPKGENGKAYVVNGDEKVDMTAEWQEHELSVSAHWNYIDVIEADLKDDGTLQGQWTRDTPLWGEVVRDFVATPIDKPDPLKRFPDTGGAPATNVGGAWEMQFAEHKAGKAILQQGADGVVRGYMKPGQLSDIRFLAGNLHGTKLGLSQFNSNAANLVLADVSADGKTMSGVMSMQNVWNEKFTGKKVDDFEFANKVKLKAGKTKVTLKGLDKYKGKPTLAIIFATWCVGCNDAAPYLHDLYEKEHAKGLEVLSVAYDLTTDVAANQAEIDKFKKKYGVQWEITQVPCTPETWPKAMPPELEGWDGMPILILVRPDQTVQTVFGGWFGPATGADGEKRKKWFEDSISTLLASAKG